MGFSLESNTVVSPEGAGVITFNSLLMGFSLESHDVTNTRIVGTTPLSIPF